MFKTLGKLTRKISDELDNVFIEFSAGYENSLNNLEFINDELFEEEFIEDLINHKNFTEIEAKEYAKENSELIINTLMQEYANLLNDIEGK